MRRITAIFLVLVMCLSFVGSLAYGEDIDTDIPMSEPAPEPSASPNVPVPDPPIPPQQNPGSQERPSIAEEPWYSPDEQPITPDIPITPEPSEDKPEEEHGLPEDQEHGETASEAPTDEEEGTPAFKESQLTLTLDCNISGFIAGRPETAMLRAVVTRSDEGIEFPSTVTWESSAPDIRVIPQNEPTEDASSRIFYAAAEYSGAPTAESANITVSAPELGSAGLTIKVSHDQFKAVIKDATGTGFVFALKNKSENTFNALDELSFVFVDSEKNADKENYENFVWEASMMSADGSGEYPVHVKKEENGDFALYSDAGLSTRHKATGDVTITLTGVTAKAFPVEVYGNEECKTVFLTKEKAEPKEDYVFYVAHPEDLELPEETTESKFLYFPPLVTIGGKEFNGYELTAQKGTIPGGKDAYKKYWEIKIPGKTGTGENNINGPVVINANTHRMAEEGDVAYPVTVSIPEAQRALFPAGGTSFPDPEDAENQEYYFYFVKNPSDSLHPIYFINDESYPLSPLPVIDEPEAENSSLYRISNITGPVTVTLGYNVSKAPMEKTVERLFTLPKETVLPGENYVFTVRNFDMKEFELPVIISTSTKGQIYPAPEDAKQPEPVTWKQESDELGGYAVFTIPSALIDGDVTIGTTRQTPVNYRVKFLDNYNTGSFADFAYKSFDFSIPANSTYSRETHIGQIAPDSALSFEMLAMPYYPEDIDDNKVPYGTTSDPFLAQYMYTGYGYSFAGSTMGGEEVSVTPAFINGQPMYIVNGGQPLTGDVLIRANLLLPEFRCYQIGPMNVEIEETCVVGGIRSTGRLKTNPTYGYRFRVKADTAQIRKVYLRVCNTTNKLINPYNTGKDFTGAGNKVIDLYGHKVTGDIVAKALRKDELDVFVKDLDPQKSNLTETVFLPDRDDCPGRNGYYYNGCIAKKGENFVFTALSTTEVSIMVDKKVLKEGVEYAVTTEGNQKRYTIPGQYMIADTIIVVSPARPSYNVFFYGKYEYTKPVDKEEGVQKDTVKAGEDYSFYLAEGNLTIYIGKKSTANGGKLLSEGSGYTRDGRLITIPAAYITGDIYITIDQVVPRRMPVYTSKKKTESGTELDIETWEYLVLDEAKIMYMLVVHADPKDGEFICYNNNKMLWVESYDGYVWFEVSEERPEDFAILSYDLIDALTDAEIRQNLAEAAEDPDAPIEISKYEEVYNITDDDKISCDVNEDGKVDEEDLTIMRRIFNCDFKDFDDIPMRCFVLADADNSGVLDMCDAEIIKCNFDRSEEKK